MALAEITETLSVSKDQLWEAITRYEEYPKFLDSCTSVKVERKGAEGPRVSYKVSMIKDVNYTLDHKEDKKKGMVEWVLVESDLFKKNTGHWEIKALGPDKTQATYSIDVEFKIPVPSLILNRLVKGSLPSMIKSFEKQAKKA